MDGSQSEVYGSERVVSAPLHGRYGAAVLLEIVPHEVNIHCVGDVVCRNTILKYN